MKNNQWRVILLTTFEELRLSKALLEAINNMGFEELTPIQAETIPLSLDGQDIIGQAQTGTGKTAAYGIPLMSVWILIRAKYRPVVAPTGWPCK